MCEELHRLAMGLHYLAGDRGAALKAYGECQQVLAEELDVEPLAELALLAEAIRQGKPAEHIVRLLGPDLPPISTPQRCCPAACPTTFAAS